MSQQTNNDPKWMFSLDFEVRDYELDLQGIVNNAVYQNYLEHTRHRFILAMGIDFHELHKNGIDPVVVRAELDYLRSLTSGDRFVVHCRIERQGMLRWNFFQEIHRVDPDELMLKAKITAVLVRNGRPDPAPEFASKVESWLARS